MSQNKPGPRELALRAIREQRANESAKTTAPQTRKEAQSMPRKSKAAAKAAAAISIPKDSKKAIVASLLKRKKGCTSRDIKDATGWPSVSVNAMAKSCGLKLRTENTDNGKRYYGTAA